MNIEPIGQQMADEHQPKKHTALSLDTKPLDVQAIALSQQPSSLMTSLENDKSISLDLTFDESADEEHNYTQVDYAKKSRSMRRDGITLTAIYHLFSGCLLLLLTCILVIPTLIFGAVTFIENAEAFIGVAIFGFMSITSMFLCLLNLIVGYGLWVQRQWARVAAIALAIVSLFGFPVFTIIGGLTLWYLLQPQIADEFTK